AIFPFANQDGVIEIAGGLAVNGDDGQVAIVLAMGDFATIEHWGKRFRLLEDLSWEHMRNVVLANDDFDVDAEVVFEPEDLDHFTARVLRARRPLDDFDIDHHALKIGLLRSAGFFANHAVPRFARGGSYRVRRLRRCGNFHAFGDDDGIAQLVVHRLDVVVAVSVMKGSDNRGVGAINYLYDRAFCAPLSTSGAKFDQHLVSAHGCIQVARRDINVAFDAVAHLCVARSHESKSIAMHRKLARHQVAPGCGRRQGVTVATHSNQFPAINQLLQALFEVSSLFTAAQPKFADQLLESRRLAWLPGNASDDLAVVRHSGILRKSGVNTKYTKEAKVDSGSPTRIPVIPPNAQSPVDR